jgi:hypothetical protein
MKTRFVAEGLNRFAKEIDASCRDVLHARHPIFEVVEIEVEVLVIEAIDEVAIHDRIEGVDGDRIVIGAAGDLDLDLVVVTVSVWIAALAEQSGIGRVVELRQMESM